MVVVAAAAVVLGGRTKLEVEVELGLLVLRLTITGKKKNSAIFASKMRMNFYANYQRCLLNMD